MVSPDGARPTALTFGTSTDAVLREQEQQALVLHLALAGHVEAGRRVAVPEEPPRLGHQLGVPRVSAVHLDHQRLARRVLGEHRPHPCRLELRGSEVEGIDAEVAHGRGDLAKARAAAG